MVYEEKVFKDIIKQDQSLKDINFYNCTFTNCTIQDIMIRDSSFKQCNFVKCTVSNVIFNHTFCVDSSFEDCSLIGINWEHLLNNNYLFNPFNSLSNCVLKYNVFYNLKLREFDFSDCDLTGAIIENCHLENGSFYNCNLRETLFTNNNLSACDFRKASNYFIDPITNIIKHAKFSFPDAMNLLNGFEIEID